MKKFLLTLVAAALSFTAMADEGMWLLPYLQKMNIKDMKAKGLKLSAEDIYSINKSSLKDAIVIFGGGCTGEIVSEKGLIFTNHHCGYGSIQALSSVEHDYLKYGFWASSHGEELPCPGLSVRFVRSIEDVTAKILGNVPSTAGEVERQKIVAENTKALVEEMSKEFPESKRAQIVPFFGGNQYFAFVYEVFNDVRLVGTPPSSIGKFGGDTDNWMWPRHTGDFSIFRVYADKDNKPAAYSKENVPYKAPRHLEISLDGVKENDFSMIMGFPGSTTRYMTSYEIDQMLEVSNPQRIFIRGERQAILWEAMEASDEIRIKYASKYAGSSNYWKNSIGMSRGIQKLGVKAQKQAQEAAFQKWANENTLPEEGFMDALPNMKRVIADITAAQGSAQYIQEAFLRGVELISPARSSQVSKGFYKDYDAALDRKVAKRMLTIARENMAPEALPSFYAEVVDKEFGGDIAKYVDYVYNNSVFTSYEKAQAASDEQKKADPARKLAESVMASYIAIQPKIQELTPQYDQAHRLYIAGLMRMQPNNAWYSDANFTIRLTYGNVLPYNPADAITYNYFTTLEGVIAKEDTSNPLEFTVEEKLKELYAKKDYGRYAAEDGKLHVGFLCNLDITGGNSGSPVLDANGRLIGLAFDGNWEAMSGDVAFEPALQRCIAVDVRYVLFVVDKFADCQHIMSELDIVKSSKKKR
ncbi:MAG: S46 family peptidase [Alistipes sp.]|nr:S46 family peptidase [Alistipes sp.]